jgi:two-component system, OmpR family, phosphate regulon response regulator PhoB
MTTILLIDDAGDDLTLTSMMLSAEGYRTMRACEARHALAMAIQRPPDVVVIDSLRFDASTSAALCLTLKSDARTRHIPIILVGDAAQAPGGREAVADVLLQEPVEIDRLIAHVGALLACGARAVQS